MSSGCPICGSELAIGQDRCDSCAASLVCPRCRTTSPPEHKFCHECGLPLTAGLAAARSTEETAERRQLTVLFCDVVGSAALASQLGDEAWSEVLGSYHATAAAAVARFGGHVAQYLGDGVLVYFGYPQAHERDAEYAVRSALAIVADLQQRNTDLAARYGVRLAVRIGIHTGPAVLGDMGDGVAREALALGDTANVAARLQEVAESDTVLVTEATLRLVRGEFITEDRGSWNLKGISEAVAAHRIVREELRHQFEAAGVQLTTFIGRQAEMALLLNRWRQVASGDGQVVLVEGEPGVGKSRLVHELRERVSGERPLWLECRASSLSEPGPLRPVADLLADGLGFTARDTPEERRQKLERALTNAGLHSASAVASVGELLGLPASKDAPADPGRRRARVFETLAAWLARVARIQPVILIFEDLQWMDPSSLELLRELVHRGAPQRVMALLVTRSEFALPWQPARGWTPIHLDRFSRAEALDLVRAASAGRPLSRDVQDGIVARGDGIALYLEELTAAVLDSSAESVAGLSGFIPDTLQDSLMARLDRLGEAKRIAQVAAVLGREFDFDLLAEVAADTPSLETRLARLMRANLLRQVGDRPGRYRFRHALIRDIAYRSLLHRARRRLHLRAGSALANHAEAGDQAGTIAHHFEAAEARDEAIRWYRTAAERAIQRAAHQEAVRDLSRALKLVERLPEGADRDEQELGLQVQLGIPLVASRSYASPDVQRAFARARELCRRVPSSGLRFRALHGLSAYHEGRGELETALELARELLRCAEQEGDPSRSIEALVAVAIPHFWRGELQEALLCFERAIAIHAPGDGFGQAQDARIVGRSFAAVAMACAGRLDEALATSREAVRLGAESGNPLSHAYALAFAGVLHFVCRQPREAQERAAQALALAREHGFAMLLGLAEVTGGWARAMLGDATGGLEALQRGAAQLAGTGTETGAPLVLGSLCDAQRSAGLAREALETLHAAQRIVEEKAHRLWEAELVRVEGELLLETSHDAESAARHFQRAVEIAGRQQAHLLELRAATSLARLYQSHGKPDKARLLLHPILSGFTQGRGAPDLAHARALLR